MDDNKLRRESTSLNPFKKSTALDTNCLLKAAMVTVGGGAMGFVMALFMNAVEFRELEYGRSKMPTRAVLRVNTIYKSERFLSNAFYE